MVKVISLGGSIVAPDVPDTPFLQAFSESIRDYLMEDAQRRLIFVVGGGGPARSWLNAAKAVKSDLSHDALDWVGIMATRLNAQLLKAIFSDLCPQDVVYNPTAVDLFAGRIMVASGWKPGFSADYDAVLLAERFQAETVINLSNIAKVYTDDPKKNPSAKPIDSISWADFTKIVGTEWVPGKNVPFDPIATKHAASLNLKVICADGKDLSNLDLILRDKPFFGTLIGA